MTVESVLTRQLGITFIDARSISTQAKLNLGIHGYPTPEQKSALINEASRIFDLYGADVRCGMLMNKDDLDEAKDTNRTRSNKSFSSSSDRSDYESDWRFSNGFSNSTATSSSSRSSSSSATATGRTHRRRRGSSLTRKSGKNGNWCGWSSRKNYGS